MEHATNVEALREIEAKGLIRMLKGQILLRAARVLMWKAIDYVLKRHGAKNIFLTQKTTLAWQHVKFERIIQLVKLRY